MAKTGKNKKENSHLLYKIFQAGQSGNGLSREEAKKPRNFRNFFSFISRNFNLLFALNIFAFLGNFPILFGLYALTGNLNISTTSPASCLFPNLYGAMTASGNSPAKMALYGVHGVQTAISLPTTATYIFYGITALIVLTFGLVNLSTVYVMRNIVKGDSTSLFSDIGYSIRKNWKQGVLVGIIDLLIIAVIGYDLLFFYVSRGLSTVYSAFFGAMVVIAFAYAIMRYYIYIMLVTFDLSIFKMIKNAFIFTILGFKRNILALLGIAIIVFFDYLFLMTSLMPIGIVLPLLILVSLCNFMGVYAAYPKVKEVMIDPYYVSDEVGARERGAAPEEETEPEEAPIFIDRG